LQPSFQMLKSSGNDRSIPIKYGLVSGIPYEMEGKHTTTDPQVEKLRTHSNFENHSPHVRGRIGNIFVDEERRE